jgi:hypothetical protein
MNRPLLSAFLLLSVLVAPRAYALGEDITWLDKTIPPALQEKLAGPTGSWKRVPASLENFTPKPETPFVLKNACAEKTVSVYYMELLARGATVLHVPKCNKLILWLATGDKGLTFTFEELQKKFLPLDSEAEALAFMVASGGNAAQTWYGATIDGVIYLMTDESYCRGLGHIRKIFRAESDARGRLIGQVIEPAPRNTGCTIRSP